MSLRLYNTATKSKEVFETDGIVGIYTCGLTVYDNPQIGNWRTFIFYDTLTRTLKFNGFDVRNIQNITDVGHLVGDEDYGEDKLAKQASLQKRTAWDVAGEYTDIFLHGMDELNILAPYKVPKATDHIREQIAMVETLEEKGYTYTIDDGVYYDTSKFEDYGKLLLGKNAKADTDFARIGENDQKRNPEDFALWKFSPKDAKRDMEWPSPWGTGFPGWHIECSAMAKKYLGETIDIHAGGIDHIPVHHTNEIAQSEAANGAEFARFWMHGEFIQVDGRKMSKSKGNVFSLDDIKAKGFTPIDFRMLVLKGHYRTETNFSWDILEGARDELASIRSKIEIVYSDFENIDSQAKQVNLHKTKFEEAMTNDLNSPLALGELHSAIKLVSSGLSNDTKLVFLELLQSADKLFGLKLVPEMADISESEKQSINERKELLKIGKPEAYKQADAIRDDLKNKSKLALLDGPNGSFWLRDHS